MNKTTNYENKIKKGKKKQTFGRRCNCRRGL